jgi:hypothetical protein
MFQASSCPSSGATTNVGRGRAGRPARARPTALLSSSSNGKLEAATTVVVTLDDWHDDARNMSSRI